MPNTTEEQDRSPHTPGPWVVTPGSVDAQDGGSICLISPRRREFDANARLIASAPELKRQRDMLLKALETLMGSVREKIGRDARSVEIWNNAVLACAKAGPSQECEDKS